MMSFIMVERLMVDDVGIVRSETVVWGTMVHWIGNIWIVGSCVMSSQGNTMLIVGIKEGHVSYFVWGNEVSIMLKDWCMVFWGIVITVMDTVWTIKGEAMVRMMIIVTISTKTINQFSNSCVNGMMH